MANEKEQPQLKILVTWWDHTKVGDIPKAEQVPNIDVAHHVARIVSVALEDQYIEIGAYTDLDDNGRYNKWELIAEYTNGERVPRVVIHGSLLDVLSIMGKVVNKAIKRG